MYIYVSILTYKVVFNLLKSRIITRKANYNCTILLQFVLLL